MLTLLPRPLNLLSRRGSAASTMSLRRMERRRAKRPSKRSGGTQVGGAENRRTGAKYLLVQQSPHTWSRRAGSAMSGGGRRWSIVECEGGGGPWSVASNRRERLAWGAELGMVARGLTVFTHNHPGLARTLQRPPSLRGCLRRVPPLREYTSCRRPAPQIAQCQSKAECGP